MIILYLYTDKIIYFYKTFTMSYSLHKFIVCVTTRNQSHLLMITYNQFQFDNFKKFLLCKFLKHYKYECSFVHITVYKRAD